MISCPGCGADNPAGQKFCGECGTPLAAQCSACGTVNPPGQKFCGECGTPLGAAAPTAAPAAPPAPSAPAAERRLVSVLFADLVSFTTFSESRDSEEVREVLSRYFELARTLIERYGGTVEKFIGDAVMAVWGTPTATEDDAERAVRAALDIVAAIPDLDPSLRARAGVLTGPAAVTLGAEGQGMVAGDLVNTAARVQAASVPGGVLVGEATRRATEQTIAYESAGVHELKGKAEPVELFRALRVVSGIGGSLKSAGLEAPFVGRDRELKLIKDLFHASASDKRAHLVSVVGVAGIGKSRLGWEFYKYFDGIVDTVWWHRGRCLAYGDGVAYWALADMVRMRCRIAEDDDPDTARQKLHATVHEHLLEPDEQTFVEPRLAQLLGLEERAGGDRQDLFPAWRLFFERLAGSNPCVLAFEDVQWADPGLLDFIEHLLEWSRDYPIYVITFARPELQERRKDWGAGQRSFTSLYLEPLPEQAMNDLLDGLVPGLPNALREQILARASGIPLYAVETVRMLLDRGLLTQDGPFYKPVGEIEALEVPETLHALIAARLDGVSPEERRLLQDGAVLGKTFTAGAAAALAGRSEEELAPLLAALVRKEVLGVQADPRSPEHGQYGFLQDLVRHVAYETLSRHERKQRHLAAAAYVQSGATDEDEVAEVLASHYLAALEAVPDADDAAEIRVSAQHMLTRAADRAASLGSLAQAQRYLDRAAELATEPAGRAALLASAARLASRDGRQTDARERFQSALEIYEQAGDIAAAASVTAGLADIDRRDGRLEAAIERLKPALPALEAGGASPELAETLAQLGRMQALVGDAEPAAESLERALHMAETLALDEVLVEGLTSKSIVLAFEGRLVESRLVVEGALGLAAAHQLHAAWFRAATNLISTLSDLDDYAEALRHFDEVVERARRFGDREMTVTMQCGAIPMLLVLGRWSEALARDEETRGETASEFAFAERLDLVALFCERGEVDRAQSVLEALSWARDEGQLEARTGYSAAEACILRANGRYAEALSAARRGLMPGGLPASSMRVKRSLIEALEAALALGDLDAAEEDVAWAEALQPGEITPLMAAQTARFRARLDAAKGDHETVEANFRRAAEIFREQSFTFYLAVTQAEYAAWLAAQGRAADAEPLLAEARETFERLEARPWLERLGAGGPIMRLAQ